METVFISYKSEDIQYVRDIQAIAKNPNNRIEFIDQSLPEAIKNEYGHNITRSPYDPDAAPVRNQIHPLLKKSNKLLVIIGTNTHSSMWVEWEITQFKNIHGSRAEILLMRHKNNRLAGMPNNIGDEIIYDWSDNDLYRWLS